MKSPKKTKTGFLLIILFLFIAIGLEAKPLEELEICFNSRDNILYGILTLPDTTGQFPVIILLHGSDRGGVDNYKEYADELVKAGYAILRYDSPGKGKSSGTTAGESFDQRVEEVMNAI